VVKSIDVRPKSASIYVVDEGPAPHSEQEVPEPPLHDANGHFAPGHRKLGGRKKGTRDRATVILEKLFSTNIRDVAKVVVEEAKNARANWACKLIVERVMAPAKETPIAFKLGAVTSPLEIPSRIQEVLGLAAAGEISLSDAERICAVLGLLRQAFETADMAQRLAAVEQKLEATGMAPPRSNGKPYVGLHG
jgi:hypothetical protein